MNLYLVVSFILCHKTSRWISGQSIRSLSTMVFEKKVDENVLFNSLKTWLAGPSYVCLPRREWTTRLKDTSSLLDEVQVEARGSTIYHGRVIDRFAHKTNHPLYQRTRLSLPIDGNFIGLKIKLRLKNDKS